MHYNFSLFCGNYFNKKRLVVLLSIFFIFCNIAFTSKARAWSMVAGGINNPANMAAKTTSLLMLMNYIGFRATSAGKEIAKNYISSAVDAGKYELEQVSDGAIKVTNNLVYKLKQGASSLVAQGAGILDAGNNLSAGQTYTFDPTVADNYDISADDPSDYLDVRESADAAETNFLVGGLSSKLDNVVGAIDGYGNSINNSISFVGSNINSAIYTVISTMHQLNSVISNKLDDVSNSVNAVNIATNTVNTSVKAVNTSVKAVNTSVKAVSTNIVALNSNLEDWFGSLNTNLSTRFGSLEGVINSNFNDFGTSIVGALETGFTDVGNRVDGVGNRVDTGFGSLEGVLEGKFSDVAGQLGVLTGTVEGTGIRTLDAVKDLPSNIADTFVGDSSLNLEPLKAIGVSFVSVFPFCLPFDFFNSIKMLNVSPVAPIFHIDFSNKYFHGGGSIDLDFGQFESWAVVIRWGVLILFVILLIFATRNIIGS